jgi:hypothetical protein
MSTSLNFAPVGSLGRGAACFTSVNPHYSSSGAPARMADGRIMTDYRPRCHQYPVSAAMTWGDNESRARMTHGAEELMEAARQLNNRKVLPTSCVDTMVPELYKRVCTWRGCKTVPGHFTGIGTGRIYVPAAAGAAADPQTLSDVSVPAIPQTWARQAPRVGSMCAADDPETMWSLKGDALLYGSSARSHPYSAPRA